MYIKQALNSAFRKIPVAREDIDKFKENLQNLLTITHSKINESEEYHKNNLRDFLNHTYYHPHHYLNTQNRNDLVIHTTNKDSQIGVIIETKKPNNKSEMISLDKFNVKSLQQLIFYYLQARLTDNNINLKYLIITDIYNWFIFPANLFEKLFYHHKPLIKEFNDFQQGRLTSTKQELFYQEIASKYITEKEQELKENFTYFNLHDYEHISEDQQLISLYKILSPQHLLKLPFANDSNSLNQDFYNELLHIIGLIEVKEKSKKLIQRPSPLARNQGSLLENVIYHLDTYNKLNNLENLEELGNNYQEQLFKIALELVITWINRILFLKLLEAQLINYNNDDKNYSFLNQQKINNFNDLDTLFFQILAKKLEDRNPEIKDKFNYVPHLNSGLFEVTELENKTLFIANLNNDYQLPLFKHTVLKDSEGKRKTGELNTLTYLFEFLSAYNFSSEGKEEIQEERKSLINASVLGLIFEKINGYQDGSFFTPGFITMYMCRETITKAVITKFNEVKKWHCQNIEQLKELIEYQNQEGRNEANSIINSITICDPAVGSGHFLVSALNEIIALKSRLNIWQDREGKRIKEYTIEVENDELIIKDEDGELYNYKPDFPPSQRIQESLFHEKKTIIENCLFGVDININSVKICRLRLWIELLKNSYYRQNDPPKSPLKRGTLNTNTPKNDPSKSPLKSETFNTNTPHNNSSKSPLERETLNTTTPPLLRGVGGDRNLETLPNIDINIKCGNSLISRFDLKSDLKLALKKHKLTIQDYQQAIKIYHNPKSREEKQEVITLIKQIKDNFTTVMTGNDPLQQQLRKKEFELYNLQNQQSLFEESAKDKKAREKQEKDLQKHINLLSQEIEDKQNNVIYRHGFEWRFEFPEVLNNNGDFIGFDMIIGNPPYIRQEEFSQLKPLLKNKFLIYNAIADLLTYFVELGYHLLKSDGVFQFIISNKFTRANYGKQMRNFLLNNSRLTHFVDFSGLAVFDEATVDACILGFVKASQDDSASLIYGNVNKDDININDFQGYLSGIKQDFLQSNLTENSWSFESQEVLKIKTKIEAQGIPLKDWDININYGIKTGFNDAFIIDGEKREELIKQDAKSAEIIKPLLRGRDIHKYYPNFQDLYLINLHNGYEFNNQRISALNVEDYPAIKQHLDKFLPQLNKRTDKGKTPYNLRNCAYIPDFEKPKIIYKDIAQELTFCLDESFFYTNNTNYMIVGDFNLSYLLANLNSKLFDFYYRLISTQLGTSAVRLFTQFVEQIPIKKVSEKEEKPFIKLVTEILAEKKVNPLADTSKLEREIDLLVYQLYGLTEEEIRIIEG
ncbi:MAG: Eco57I restriction-modification methylase domain-containing protein [Cyanobacterium sp. T60_A2020_053]|nr:Eco57I restriction-modification methylase domain-containing protein [Cyanobacterium sp. T60_A2020_053]